MRLRVTKSRLYNLVRNIYPSAPPMRRTEFMKAPRTRSYWLKFEGRTYYLSAVCGKALLTINDNPPVGERTRTVLHIPLAELKQYDLVEGDED